MKRYRVTIAWILLGTLATWSVGCTMTQRGAALGALVGAGAGAIIGHNTSAGKGTGALIGAGLGGLGGALAGDALDEKRERDEHYRSGYPEGTMPMPEPLPAPEYYR